MQQDPFGFLTPIDRNQLIQTYAVRRYTVLWQASKSAQERAERKWLALQAFLKSTYPDLNLNQPYIQRELERRADAWWSVKAAKGAGIDW